MLTYAEVVWQTALKEARGDYLGKHPSPPLGIDTIAWIFEKHPNTVYKDMEAQYKDALQQVRNKSK